MSEVSQASTNNLLLRLFSPGDFDGLAQYLEPVTFNLRDVFAQADQPLPHAYFIERGYASVVAGPDGTAVEIGMIGREGLVGVPLILGLTQSPFDIFVQLPGWGLRIDATQLQEVASERPSIQRVLLKYAHTFQVQIASTAFVNAEQTLEMRLARWLLMAHDRAEGDQFPITHEFLSLMLGVRRAGVTTALHVLEGIRAIRATRGHVTVLAREKLHALSEGGYGIPEAEYARIFGSTLSDLTVASIN